VIQAPGRTKNRSLDPIAGDRWRLDPVQTIPLGVDVPLEVAQPRLGPVELEAVKIPLLPGPGSANADRDSDARSVPLTWHRRLGNRDGEEDAALRDRVNC
jgi:hypothetical protein